MVIYTSFSSSSVGGSSYGDIPVGVLTVATSCSIVSMDRDLTPDGRLLLVLVVRGRPRLTTALPPKANPCEEVVVGVRVGIAWEMRTTARW